MTGGGVSTFYTSNLAPGTFNAAVRAFFQNANGLLPQGTTIIPPAVGELIDVDTGEVSGTWSQPTPPAPVNGVDLIDYAQGVGCRVALLTGGITRGRRVRGSTFIVPIGSGFFNTGGNVDSTVVISLQTAANTLIAADSASMRIYSRPQVGASTGGVSHPVTGAFADGRATWLRSRRT